LTGQPPREFTELVLDLCKACGENDQYAQRTTIWKIGDWFLKNGDPEAARYCFTHVPPEGDLPQSPWTVTPEMIHDIITE
jgi:hypothetical protein